MIFIDDIKYLPKDVINLFDPKPYTSKYDIIGHCVYGYLREQTDKHGPAMSVRYIGEGRPDRPTEGHWGGVPDPKYIVIFRDNITKDQSLLREKILVDYFGRIVNGTGILENIRAGGGGWGAKGLSWTLDSKTCQYCNSKFGRLDIHEPTCDQNPNKVEGHNIGKKHRKSNCQHCDNLVSINRLAFHELTCKKNPNSIPNPKKGKSHNKQECKYCEKLCSVCNIERHEKSCKFNPSRINGATKGRRSERKGTKLCKECGYVMGCIHIPIK
jgi:hypothetical protein